MELPKRKSNRLKEYDYRQNGSYFITICVKDTQELLWDCAGAIINRPDQKVQLSKYGLIVDTAINNISKYYPQIIVDKYVIMPNHVHMILFNMTDDNGRLIIAPTISTVIKQMKRYVSKQIGFSVWQKSFHDHIIRNKQGYLKIWQYIDENPFKWQEDCYYKKGEGNQ